MTNEDDPISIKQKFDGYTFLLAVFALLSLYLFDDYFSTSENEKNALLRFKAVVEKAPELHISSSGKSRRYYVAFKIRGSEEVEIDEQAAFSMQEFIDEVKSGDTVVIRTHFHALTEENHKIGLSSTSGVIGISKNGKEYIDYEIYSKKVKKRKLSWFFCAVWASLCSLYFREAQETPQIFGRKLKFVDTLIYGIIIIFFLINFF
jgi:hypothetical protein